MTTTVPTLHELYTENGRLTGISLNHVGREAIRGYGAGRAKQTNRFARHVCSNLRLMPVSESRVQGFLTITLFRHDGPGGPAEPCAVADAYDTYVRGDDGQWRLEERRLELVFESEAHKTPPKKG